MKRLSMVLGVGAMALALVGCAAPEGEEGFETIASPLVSGAIGNNEFFFKGQVLWSSGCTHRVVMQGDGNLVIYNRNGTPIWNAGTVGHNDSWAALQSDGNFVIYPRDGGTALWSTKTFSGQRLQMQGDGNLVLISYTVSSDGVPIWSSGKINNLSANCSTPRASEVTYVQANTNLPGSDISGMPITGISKGACGNACAARSDCLAYTFASTGCWLKNAVPTRSNATGMTSGIKKRRCEGATTC